VKKVVSVYTGGSAGEGVYNNAEFFQLLTRVKDRRLTELKQIDAGLKRLQGDL
jgi:hypothetical protein